MVALPMLIKVPLYFAFSACIYVISKSMEQEQELIHQNMESNSKEESDFNEENPDYLLKMISLPYH